MWADTLYLAERAHLLRLFAWSGGSLVVGALLLALPAVRRRSPLALNFALQTAAWGAVVLAFATLSWRGLRFRDLDGYTQLDRLLWLNVGLDVGYVGIGATLLVTALVLGRRLAPAGAGLGIIVQGLALLVLDVVLLVRLAALDGV
jgi:hypothetical protein